MKNIEWQIDSDKKLYLIDADATKVARDAAEAKAAEEGLTEEEIKAAGDAAEVVYAGLNPGRTWIGWASQNNGGELEIGDGAFEGCTKLTSITVESGGKITKIGKKADMMLDIIGATLEGGICGRMNVEEGGAR